MKKPIIRRNFQKLQKRVAETIEDQSPIQIELVNTQAEKQRREAKLDAVLTAAPAIQALLDELNPMKKYAVDIKGPSGKTDIWTTLANLSVNEIKDLLKAIDRKTPISGRTTDNDLVYYPGGIINHCIIKMGK